MHNIGDRGERVFENKRRDLSEYQQRWSSQVTRRQQAEKSQDTEKSCVEIFDETGFKILLKTHLVRIPARNIDCYCTSQ